jgi:hypothetical protein
VKRGVVLIHVGKKVTPVMKSVMNGGGKRFLKERSRHDPVEFYGSEILC